ncbi:DUF4145 domain-containing protein [Falsiroseomonas sp.]|uniref:DUF4145 domain-containing protein n=1 Tax=Falsiroseomonas sp. TaxID=2870721 RepID=UPI003F718576
MMPFLLPAFGSPAVDKSVQGTLLSGCVSCQQLAVWVSGKIVHPATELAALPHPEMPKEAIKTFREAAIIAALSPRSATALLRLAVEQICRETDVKPARINEMIAELVAKGLPSQVQMALDIVRVTGNDAVHPGQIDTDNAETAAKLFDLVNLVVEEVIARPRRIREMYDQIPAAKREEIERRNARAQGK